MRVAVAEDRSKAPGSDLGQPQPAYFPKGLTRTDRTMNMAQDILKVAVYEAGTNDLIVSHRSRIFITLQIVPKAIH